MFTVKQLSRLAGVTPRTLHHYDAIGLLKPSRVGENGYRYYGEESLLRLQQILFYRELDLPLEDIKHIMGRRDFDELSALESHKMELANRVERLKRLIAPEERLLPSLQPAYQLHEVELERWEAELLPKIDGTRTVAELVAMSGRPEHVLNAFLVAMVALNVLERRA